MRRGWVLFACACAVIVAVNTAGCAGSCGGTFFDRRMPRERYVASLLSAGLGDTALVRGWIAAGQATHRDLREMPPRRAYERLRR